MAIRLFNIEGNQLDIYRPHFMYYEENGQATVEVTKLMRNMD